MPELHESNGPPADKRQDSDQTYTKWAEFEARMQKQLEESQARAVATIRAKAESNKLYMAKISHEFRSPLQVIVGTVDLLGALLEGHQNPAVSRAIANLDTASRQLQASSNDLANYLRSDSTLITIKSETIDLVAFLKRCVDFHADDAARKGLLVRMHSVEPSIEWTVDPARLDQIMTNLIGNAVKYTATGCIDVHCHRMPSGEVCIAVKDTGTGIAEDALKHICEPWYRVNDSVQGMGLGLAIVKATADAIGAKFDMKSKVGIGTEMTVILPGPKGKAKTANPPGSTGGHSAVLANGV